ncbi:MAG: 3-dehydroquinate synthase, partial [Rhodospirillales bacterium]
NYAGFENVEIDVDGLRNAMSKDKKNIGRNSVTLILPGRDGTLFRAPYDNDDRFADACSRFLQEGRTA